MQADFLPWAKPDFWGNERQYVDEALTSSWISGGPFVERLEAEFRLLCGSRHAIAVSNGTTALHLAYLSLDIRPGDEVIVPGFGFLAAANVALHMSAVPIFCEVDERTWCMRAEDIARVLTRRTRAIVVVHTYGNVCDMDAIMALARENGVPVIEDAAEAFPSTYRGKLAGTIADIGTYSFQATKTITTGEGGMVVANDVALADRMVLYRSHGLLRKRHYWHEVPGHNFRLTNMQAALGCAQLEQLDRIERERRRVYATYCNCLNGMRGVTFQEITPGVDPVVWAVALQLDRDVFPQGRDAVLTQMMEQGIELRPGFYAASQLDIYDCESLPRCEALASSIISVPSFPALTEAQIDRICMSLARIARL
jgi:perosamine synthetase